ncbi:hypothetical protein LCGC14_1722450 [marine sediment metagenome]|uniref:HTH cro/C1-type domain-containing protein n=1 Tax=marine sediment metagenome TaxID=412755 RepID=A0A0F9HZQ5_9ZZZZ
MKTGNKEMIPLLKEVMRRRGRKPSQFAKDIGVSHATVSRWLHGLDTPKPASCEKFAEYSGEPLVKVMAAAGYMPGVEATPADRLPEFREYAQLKYPEDLDEDLVQVLEDLIERRRQRRWTAESKEA